MKNYPNQNLKLNLNNNQKIIDILLENIENIFYLLEFFPIQILIIKLILLYNLNIYIIYFYLAF